MLYLVPHRSRKLKNAKHKNNPRRVLPRRRWSRWRHRWRGSATARWNALWTTQLDCKRLNSPQLSFEWATRRCIPSCELIGTSQTSWSSDGLDHNGTGRHAIDVRLKFDLCCHGAVGQWNCSYGRTHNRNGPWGTWWPHPRSGKLPSREGPKHHGSERTFLRGWTCT